MKNSFKHSQKPEELQKLLKKAIEGIPARLKRGYMIASPDYFDFDISAEGVRNARVSKALERALRRSGVRMELGIVSVMDDNDKPAKTIGTIVHLPVGLCRDYGIDGEVTTSDLTFVKEVVEAAGVDHLQFFRYLETEAEKEYCK